MFKTKPSTTKLDRMSIKAGQYLIFKGISLNVFECNDNDTALIFF